jgi:methionine sulfoxide reductase heme-binding subunit
MAAVASPAARRHRPIPDPWLKPGIFIGALFPLVWILLRLRGGGLGANPIQEVENELGLSALIFLVASTACTPAKRLWGWTWAIRIRRELGLFAFFYALVHFLIYFVDQYPNWGGIPEDILKRPFITVGFTALVLLVPLAVTSTKGSVRRLGYIRWQQIHWLTYPAVALAAVHFIWRVKRDLNQPLTYALIVAVLLAVRLVWWLQKRYASGETLA